MRTFLIFLINDSYYTLYRNYPKSIYNILNQIYHLKKDNLTFASNILKSITEEIDKEEIDKKLFLKLHKDIPYSKRGSIHIFNNFYLGEITTMEIKYKYIKITSSKDQNYFLESLINFDKKFFVCDFKNGDYFFLESLVVNNV